MREYALKLDYTTDPRGRWPGLRTQTLDVIDPNLFHAICTKVFALFFNVLGEESQDLQWRVGMYFQKVDSSYYSNFIHQDHPDSIWNGILYLTPNAPLHTGTTLYRPKNPWVIPDQEYYMNLKTGSYLNNSFDSDEFRQAVDEYNSFFEPTMEIHNVYNRLALFDSIQHHGAASYENAGAERLFLIFFVTQLSHHILPIRNKDAVNNL